MRLDRLELIGPVLERALEPFPSAVRTLDAVHLASMDFLRTRGVGVRLASYDERLTGAGSALDIDLIDLE